MSFPIPRFANPESAFPDVVVINAAWGLGENVVIGICGQAPSDHPDFAHFLVQNGIDSISLNPDSVIPVIERLGNDD